MLGNTEVVDYLNTLLAGELGARDQYFIHSRMYDEWSYKKLYERINHEMADETLHADALIRRILMLDGTPDMRVAAVRLGKTVPEMLRFDLDVEEEVRTALREGIVICERVRDFVTRDILLAQLGDTEEDHAYWLEQQLRQITMVGLENYLQAQMKATESDSAV